MLRGAIKLGIRSRVCAVFIDRFQRKHHLHIKLPYRFFSVMGVTVSSKREKKVVKRVPPPSFASFSTTGTLTTSAYVEDLEGELARLKLNIKA